MNLRQRMPPSLTRLETALSALMQGVVPVVPTELPLATALGRIVAALPAFSAIPPYHVASVDGWAIHTRDIVGASSYLPVTLASAPLWLDAGDRVPDDCNCVLGPDLIDHIGTIVQVLDDAIPWQGVLRGGGYISEGVHALVEGSKLRALDLLVARAAGFERMPVRCPRVQIIDLTARGCTGISTQFILECCISSGVDATAAQTCGRDALAVAKLLDAAPCDLIVTIGGTGIGRTDAAVAAVAMCGIVGAHGIALQPGRTAAIGKIKDTPLCCVGYAVSLCRRLPDCLYRARLPLP
jgi:molybdopterin molybdotransferase